MKMHQHSSWWWSVPAHPTAALLLLVAHAFDPCDVAASKLVLGHLAVTTKCPTAPAPVATAWTLFVQEEACCVMVKIMTKMTAKFQRAAAKTAVINSTLKQELEEISLRKGPGGFNSSFCNKTNSTSTTNFAETAKGTAQCSTWSHLFISKSGCERVLRWQPLAKVSSASHQPLSPRERVQRLLVCHTRAACLSSCDPGKVTC